VRRDTIDKDSRYLYLSSTRYKGPSPGSPVHVPLVATRPGTFGPKPGTIAVPTLPTPPSANTVRLTEGELKADVATALSGLLTISVPGASCWRPALPVLKELGCRTVRLAYDADVRTNPIVARALVSCIYTLLTTGFDCELECWERADGRGI